MITIIRPPLPWPAAPRLTLVAVGPRQAPHEAWAQHLQAVPGDVGAAVIHFYLAGCGDDACDGGRT